MFSDSNDTIFALASGARKSAVAIFRVSGPRCIAALESITRSASFPNRRAVLRIVRDPLSGETIDSALITRFEAPASFTGEDVAEIGLTGGRAVVAAMARALASVEGLRPAEAGEFAWRAFVNGKMDLSSVEGLADLVDAETEAQRRQAQRIAGGALRRECDAIRSALIGAMATVEALLDFSDVDEVDKLSLAAAMRGVAIAKERIDRALDNANKASRLRDGFSVVIAGAPNTGKSTLMNALAGRDVAITSPLAGTTRDAIEVFLDLGGYPVVMIDTAGIRATGDPIEQEGIKRARERARAADLVLWLEERNVPSSLIDADFPIDADCPVWIVRTKSDLGLQSEERPSGISRISAKTGEGISKLLSDIGELAEASMSSAEAPILALERHQRAFQDSQLALCSALANSTDLELVAENLRHAASYLDRVIGRIGIEDVLGEIFSRLCIGK